MVTGLAYSSFNPYLNGYGLEAEQLMVAFYGNEGFNPYLNGYGLEVAQPGLGGFKTSFNPYLNGYGLEEKNA